MSFNAPPRSAFASFPPIRRARGYRLYGPDGRRYLDLYQDAGRAMAGHRPQGLGSQAKSALEKLGTASLPSPWLGRIDKLLGSLFPAYPHVLRFNSYAEALSRLGLTEEEVWDPWGAGYGSTSPAKLRLSLWRPYLSIPESEYLLPVVPGAGDWGGVVILSRTEEQGDASPLPAFAEAAFERGLRLYGNLNREGDKPLWDSFPDRLWRRRGPYLFPRVERMEYGRFAADLIAAGIYPSPDYETPSIIPAEFTPGEVKKLRAMEALWITES